VGSRFRSLGTVIRAAGVCPKKGFRVENEAAGSAPCHLEVKAG
jgi:hypothetical protein